MRQWSQSPISAAAELLFWRTGSRVLASAFVKQFAVCYYIGSLSVCPVCL